MWAEYNVSITEVLLCYSNLMTEATVNNNLTGTCVQNIVQITNKEITAVARMLPAQQTSNNTIFF